MSTETQRKGKRPAPHVEMANLHDQLVNSLTRLVGLGQNVARERDRLHREVVDRGAAIHRARERLAERIGDGGADSPAARLNDVMLAHELRHHAVGEALRARAHDLDEDDEGQGGPAATGDATGA